MPGFIQDVNGILTEKCKDLPQLMAINLHQRNNLHFRIVLNNWHKSPYVFYDFEKGQDSFYKFEGYRHFNYGEVLKNNQFLLSKVNFINKNFKQNSCLIIVSKTFGYQAMYYLPAATVVIANIHRQRYNAGYTIFRYFKRNDFNGNYFAIPQGIDKLILFDDIFIPYFRNSKIDAICYEVGYSYRLLVHNITNGQKIIFAYNSIRIK